MAGVEHAGSGMVGRRAARRRVNNDTSVYN